MVSQERQDVSINFESTGEGGQTTLSMGEQDDQDEEMPSQGERMSCEPPLSDKEGREGTNSSAGIEMKCCIY